MKKLLLMVAVLAIASAGAALAGSCAQYCGEFSGFRWCSTTCR
jgi:opacity protein-like surface antigen